MHKVALATMQASLRVEGWNITYAHYWSNGAAYFARSTNNKHDLEMQMS